MGIHEIILRLDDLDYEAVQRSIAHRQTWRVMPDATHDDANMSGRILAEICRGWEEFLSDRFSGEFRLDDDDDTP